MSQFFTHIPTQAEEALKALPPHSSVERIVWDAEAKSLCLIWQHERLVTRYTSGNNFPLEALMQKQLPEGVRMDTDLGFSAHGTQGEPAAGEFTNRPLETGENPTQEPKPKAESRKRKAKAAATDETQADTDGN